MVTDLGTTSTQLAQRILKYFFLSTFEKYAYFVCHYYGFCYGVSPCNLYVLVLMLVKLCKNLYIFLAFLAFYFITHICLNDEKYTSNYMLNQEEKKQCAHSLGMYVMTRVVVDPLIIQFLPCF
jgi:hypothetical protein